MKKKFIVSILCFVFLSACSNLPDLTVSPKHKVVNIYAADDNSLSCSQIDIAITRVQSIIDGVNRDKEDVTATDVVDNILWWPFNVKNKSKNYDEALTAANKRISNLKSIKKAKTVKNKGKIRGHNT